MHTHLTLLSQSNLCIAFSVVIWVRQIHTWTRDQARDNRQSKEASGNKAFRIYTCMFILYTGRKSERLITETIVIIKSGNWKHRYLSAQGVFLSQHTRSNPSWCKLEVVMVFGPLLHHLLLWILPFYLCWIYNVVSCCGGCYNYQITCWVIAPTNRNVL